MKNVKYINAGAGSGKTWTLSHRLSDALLEKDDKKRVEPSQVILTTFTRAAASEFREKARAVLIKAGKPEVAAALEGAAIGTVHSVCEQFVKKYWYRLGLSPEMSVLQEEDKQIYVNQSVASILKERDVDITFFNDFRRDFNIVKVENFIPYPYADWWKDSLKAIISMMSYYGIHDLNNSITQSSNEVDAIFCGPALDTTEMLDFLIKYEDYVSGENSNTAKKALRNIQSIRKSPNTLPSTVAVNKIVDFSGKTSEFVGGAKNGVKKFLQKYPDFDFDVFRHNLQAQMISNTFGTKVKKVTDKIFSLAKEWQKEYRKYKELNHVLDFDDLEQYFLKMLRDNGFEDIREEIKDTYKLLMVDEFQDSNPVQISIFDKLSDLIAEGGGTTVCVGDPKQSIYAFRGSDTELIKDVSLQFQKEVPLTTSYRSRPRLVDLSNKVFLQAFQGVLDKKDIELPEKDRDASELSGKEPILHWDVSDVAALAAKISDILYANPWTVCLKKEEGEKMGKEVQIHPKDIAILCRYGYEVKAVVAALREAGIPVTSSNMDFVNWAECQLLQSLLRWINDPYDDGAKADIWHLMEDIPSEDILLDRKHYLESPVSGGWLMDHKLFKKLNVIRERVHTLSVSSIISTLILELDLMRICQKWGHPAARCKNLGLMQKIAAQYEEHCVQMNLAASLSGFISYIHTMPDDLKNEDTTSDTVKVMTYHKSKGLEWPVVILKSLSREVNNNDVITVREYSGVKNCKNTSGENWIFFFPPLQGTLTTLPNKIQNNIVASPLYEDIKQRYLREETRLLYVGLTRGRDYVVTLSKNGGELQWIRDCGCGSGEVKVSGGKVNPWKQSGFEAEYSRIADMPVSVPAPQKTTSDSPDPKQESQHNAKYISPSKVTPPNEISVSLTEVFKGLEMKHSIDKDHSAECGTCVHNFFAAYQTDDVNVVNLSIARRLINGAGLSKQLFSPESVVSSANQFFSWIGKEYPTTEKAKREVPFFFMTDGNEVTNELLVNGQTARGEMDLLWVLDNNRKTCVLVDYKSYHGNPNLDSQNQEVRKHYQGYAPQLLLYKIALEKAGWTVVDVLVYYFIQGRVVRFIF